jgi:hypothetical protein
MRKSHFKALYALKAANKKSYISAPFARQRMWADRFSELAKRELVPRRPINFVLPRGQNSKI